MNRKVTQEQNDISLIFGNLPKRLQMKIAANCFSAGDAENAENNEVPMCKQLSGLNVKASGKNSERIREETATVLEASGSACRKEDNKPTKTGKKQDLGIPGILHVNTADATQLKRGGKCQVNNVKNNQQLRRRARVQTNHAQEGGVVRLRELQLPASPVRIRLTTEHPAWFEDLLDMPGVSSVIKLYDQLIVLQERDLLLVHWDKFCEVHEKLQNGFKKLVLEHLKFACEQKVDTFFWKLLLYNIREHLKAQKSEDAAKHILPLIDQSLSFYRTLLTEMKAKYMNAKKYESIAKVVSQRLLICMGDLCRYRAKHKQSNDFSDTFKYYHEAQALIPANGAPYNQLAIVAVHARKKFEAIYYYMRSLLTSNAIQTAKESLLDLFEDIRKKYEDNEMKCSPLHQPAFGQHKLAKPIRKEVWIYPDGVRRLHRTDVKHNSKNKATIAEQERFDGMSTDELLRRITNLYLYLIGKFYTGIGLESVYHHQRKLFIEFSVALKHNNLLTRSKVLKIVALNIFVVEHNNHKESRREIRYHAFNFCNTIFGLMLRRANQILVTPKQNINIEDLEDNFVELNTTLQYIRIYVKWLLINVDIWEPIRNEDHSFIDCWQELQLLFRNIERIFEKQKDDLGMKLKYVVLDEDIYLNGFAPLGRDINNATMQSSMSESMQFLKRIQKIAEFEQSYEEYRDCLQVPINPSFVLEELNSAMQSALHDFTSESETTDLSVGSSSDENITPCSSSEMSEVNSSSDTDGSQQQVDAQTDASLTQLCKLKRELEEKTKAKMLCNAKLQEILKFVDTKTYIEVRPRYLLPDTNCFIDCLEDFERLAEEFTRYTLIIPLTVVKELDGLSKGVKLDLSKYAMQKQRIHHFDEVSSRAKKSLEFIRKAKNNVRCATTKGSIINASLFALVEEEYATNDDKILATAVALSKSLSIETCKDGKCFIQTELVLITTDRNLRVKALSRNLAVSSLDEFVQWAKDSNAT